MSTVKKSQARMPAAWARRKLAQRGPAGRDASPNPRRRSTLATVLGDTFMPHLPSSPAILGYPQRGFSEANRRIASTICGSTAGRPLRRFG